MRKALPALGVSCERAEVWDSSGLGNKPCCSFLECVGAAGKAVWQQKMAGFPACDKVPNIGAISAMLFGYDKYTYTLRCIYNAIHLYVTMYIQCNTMYIVTYRYGERCTGMMQSKFVCVKVMKVISATV